MRRGLIEWSKTELPESVFDTRIATMRTAMDAAKIGALVAYTNFTRPSAVSWLCDFIPYWSECALVLPKTGAMSMISAVSPRGKPWIESTTYSENLLFTPKIAPETARVLTESLQAGSTIGIVEIDEIPAALGLALKGIGMALTDATDAFVSARASGDAANTALARIAAGIAHAALAAIGSDVTEGTAAVAAVDLAARRAGAEESYVAIAPDLRTDRRLLRLEGPAQLGDVFALRATVAYKGTWVRMVRTIVRNDTKGVVSAGAAAFAAAIADLPKLDKISTLDTWLIETARAAQPLDAVAGSAVPRAEAFAPGSLVSVQASAVIDGIPILVGSPVLTGSNGTAGTFLVAHTF